MPVTLPFDLTVPVKREIKAAELMAMYNALAAKFSAGIVDADCSTNMNLNGNKLLANTMPANRIIDGSVTQTQLAAASVGTSQLIDLNVTTGKIADLNITKGKIPNSELPLGKLAITMHAIPFTNSPFVESGLTPVFSAGINPTSNFPVATYECLGAYVKDVSLTVLAGSRGVFSLIPNGAGANWAGILRYAVAADSTGTMTITGTVVYVFIART